MFTDLIANFALLTAFLFLFNLLFGNKKVNGYLPLRFKTLAALLNGLFAIVLMNFSVSLSPHTFLDFRQLMILSSASLGGLYGSVITGLLVILGRIFLFGGLNASAVAASISALVLSIGSGLISRKFYAQSGRFWSYSLLLSLLCTSVTLIYLMGNAALRVLPVFTIVLLVGGLFVASLTAYFSFANRLQLELKASEKRYRQLHAMQESILQSASGVAIIAADLNGIITLFNKGAEKMLGYPARLVIGHHTPLLYHRTDEVDKLAEQLSRERGTPISGFQALVARAEETGIDEREWTFVCQSGDQISVNVSLTTVKDAEGSIVGFMGVSTNITERKLAVETLSKANELLSQLSLLDGLTGIANRRHFDQTLTEAWTSSLANGQSLALILFDIDCFKKYNDTYGHQAGDDCLIQVAATAKACLRAGDLLARYGGEEFAVILPDTSLQEAGQMAEQIRVAIQNLDIPHSSADAGFISVSLGAAALTGSAQEGRLFGLIADADRALYHAKQSGRNRLCLAEAEEQPEALSGLAR